MANFHRTRRSLSGDGFRGYAAGILVGSLLIAAWLGWFLFGGVTAVGVPESARGSSVDLSPTPAIPVRPTPAESARVASERTTPAALLFHALGKSPKASDLPESTGNR